MKQKILIIEDNALNMKLFRNILLSSGYDVETAGDGDAGLELLSRGGVDLLLIDIRLPGKSGIEIIDEIRKSGLYKDLKIVAVTASAMKEEIEEIKTRKCDAYILKPISLKPFREKISEVLSTGADREEKAGTVKEGLK